MIFNIFIVFFLFIAVFWVISGKGQIAELTHMLWLVGIVMVLSLLSINTVYMLNRKLLGLLETENWPALSAYLEKKVYEEERYTPRYVKLLAQSCLAARNFDGAINLKQRLAAVKPAMVEDNALILGAAYLLGGNTAAAVSFFQERLEKVKPQHHASSLQGGVVDWLCWYYGFSLILTGAAELAGTVMEELASGARDMLVTALAAFLLTELAGKSPSAPAEWRVRAEEGKSRVRKALKTAEKWTKKAKKLKAEIHGAVIRNYVDRAGAWVWERN
jgi:hypothetical protein